jgi:hypothetical protein
VGAAVVVTAEELELVGWLEVGLTLELELLLVEELDELEEPVLVEVLQELELVLVLELEELLLVGWRVTPEIHCLVELLDVGWRVTPEIHCLVLLEVGWRVTPEMNAELLDETVVVKLELEEAAEVGLSVAPEMKPALEVVRGPVVTVVVGAKVAPDKMVLASF